MRLHLSLFKIMPLLLFCILEFAYAQIGIKISSERKRYLRYEPVEITLLIQNNSGNTLIFGKDNRGKPQGRLLFSVRSPNGRFVRPLDPNANPIDGLIFAPGQIRELKLMLNNFYDLQAEDFYNINAYLEHQRISKAFESNQLTIEVREGTTLYEKKIGLPTEKADDPIHTVTATLMRFDETENDIYCLRIDDEDRVYGTFRVGPYIQASKPQMEADEASAIHVLVQIYPRLYKYAVFSVIHGEATQRIEKYFVPDAGVPTLSRTTGYLKVLHARQAKEGVDFKYEPKKNK